MGQAIKCPSCGRLVSAELEACPFCKGALPGEAVAAAAPRATEPVKCEACGRLAAASFTDCPFCKAKLSPAKTGGSVAPPPRARPITIPPAPPPGARPKRYRPPARDEDDAGDDDAGGAMLLVVLAIVLLIGASFGVATYFRYDTLVREGQGLGRAAFLPALVVGLGGGTHLIQRFEEEPLADTAARLGLVRLLVACGFAGLVLALPIALTIYGALMTVNSAGIAGLAEDLRCSALRVDQIISKSRGTTVRGNVIGYRVAYACELPDGTEARGEMKLHDEPRVRTGGSMKMSATRGRLGVWVRTGGVVPGSEQGGAKGLDEVTE